MKNGIHEAQIINIFDEKLRNGRFKVRDQAS